MDADVILSKCLTLLYRESQLETLTEPSHDLVLTALEKIKLSGSVLGEHLKRDTTLALKNLVLEMARNEPGHLYDASSLLQQVRIITNGDENLYKAIAQAVEGELEPPQLKRTITSLRKSVGSFYREQRQLELIRRAEKDLSYGRHNIPDVTQYIQNFITELEITAAKTAGKDAGIVRSLDLGDDVSVREVFDSVTASNTEDLSFKTGWRELNDALLGGPRPGDCMQISALQHNYKSGFSLTTFAQIALFNKPKTKDPNKKPLLYRVSLEDPVRNNAQFLYQFLKYDETRQPVSVKGVSTEEMSDYVKKRLQINGYHVLIDEVNPLNWTYHSLINRIIELESQGYAVEVLSVDYLAKLPTTGCSQGAIGDDMMDMLSRIRAFCSANGILFMTPHQLSTEAMRLLQTVPAEQFLNHIKGGGFFEKSKGLGRIYDIGVLIHKVESAAGDYLHVLIDKHRFPVVADSYLKSFYLQFPSNKMPIPNNLEDEGYKVLRKIPRSSASVEDDMFI